MAHKLDKKRHKLRKRAELRALKRRYMKATKGDTLAPNEILAELKDSEQVERLKRVARRLARRGVETQLYSE